MAGQTDQNAEEGAGPASGTSSDTLFHDIGHCWYSVKTDFSPDNRGFQPSPLIPIDVIKSCVNALFATRYLTMPILNHHHVYATLSTFMTLLSNMGRSLPLRSCYDPACTWRQLSRPSASLEILIQQTLRARQFFNFLEVLSLALA